MITRQRLEEIALGTDHDDGSSLNELIEAVADLLDERDRVRKWADRGTDSIAKSDVDYREKVGYLRAAGEVDDLLPHIHEQYHNEKLRELREHGERFDAAK